MANSNSQSLKGSMYGAIFGQNSPRRKSCTCFHFLQAGERLAERICSTVTNFNTSVKNKFCLHNTLGAPRTQEYHFSLSAGCIHYSVELRTASLVLIQNNFYQVCPNVWLHWVYDRQSWCIWEKMPTPLHLDSWSLTAWDLEYVR